MFRIELASHLGAAVGEITIGTFRESFELDVTAWSPAAYSESWHKALGALINGAPRIALMTWALPLRPGAVRRAYVLYREGDDVFIQERLFLPDATDAAVAGDGGIADFRPRETISEDGIPLSEWRTSVADVEEFLRVAG